MGIFELSNAQESPPFRVSMIPISVPTQIRSGLLGKQKKLCEATLGNPRSLKPVAGSNPDMSSQVCPKSSVLRIFGNPSNEKIAKAVFGSLGWLPKVVTGPMFG